MKTYISWIALIGIMVGMFLSIEPYKALLFAGDSVIFEETTQWASITANSKTGVVTGAESDQDMIENMINDHEKEWAEKQKQEQITRDKQNLEEVNKYLKYIGMPTGKFFFNTNGGTIEFALTDDDKLDIQIHGYSGMTEAAEYFIEYIKSQWELMGYTCTPPL